MLTHLTLQQRTRSGSGETYVWNWNDLPGTSATLVLDPQTVLVAVEVIVLRVPPRNTRVDRPFAQLVFDGRTIDRLAAGVSNGGSGFDAIVDNDPRPSWDIARFDNLSNGRQNEAGAGAPLEIDQIYSQCGDGRTASGSNIQFRMVNYAEVTWQDLASPECNISRCGRLSTDTLPASACNPCIAAAHRVADLRAGVSFPHAVPVLIIADDNFSLASTGFGWTVGNACDSGVIIDEYFRSFTNLPLALVAGHEIGHILGLNHNNAAGNLMNAAGGIGETIDPTDCVAAYSSAQGHRL